MKTARERIQKNIIIDEEGCWIWQLSKNHAGYGMIRVNEGHGAITRLAHRISYIVHKGPIPKGMVMAHICVDKWACVNPDHLIPTTNAHNRAMSRGRNAPLQKCPKGHPYNEKNTYITPKGYQSCRQCRYISAKKLSERRKLGLR